MVVAVLVQENMKFSFCYVSWLKILFLPFLGRQKPLENWLNAIEKQALPIQVLF